MHVTVAGIRDRNIDHLVAAARAALDGLGLDGDVTMVSDHDEIVSLGVVRTPGLVVDGRVVVEGRVPNGDEVRDLLAQAR
jgi:hypothetical protein